MNKRYENEKIYFSIENKSKELNIYIYIRSVLIMGLTKERNNIKL